MRITTRMSGKILFKTILKNRVIKTISLKSLVISLATSKCSKMEFKIIYSKNNCSFIVQSCIVIKLRYLILLIQLYCRKKYLK